MEQENLGLTGRQKLIYEAFEKIYLGNQMRREGLIELNNLIPQSDPPESMPRTVAPKMLRAPSLFRKKMGDSETIDRILDLIDEKPKVTANYLHTKLKIGSHQLRRLKDKMKKAGLLEEKKSSDGIIWSRPRPTAKPKNYVDATANADLIYEFLKNNNWVTTHKLVDALKLTWYPVKRTLEYLVAKGSAKQVKRAHNPVHKGVASYGRAFKYWEAV